MSEKLKVVNTAISQPSEEMTNCCRPSEQQKLRRASVKEMLDEKEVCVTNIKIQQMCCPSEERVIRAKLEDMKGIYELNFRLLDKTLTVTHSAEVLDFILQRIRAVGYEPELASQQQTADQQGFNRKYLQLIVASVLALVSEVTHWLSDDVWLSAVIALLAVMLCGFDTYRKGWRSLVKFELNINALMSIAITGAFFLGEWPEAAMVMVLFSLAEKIEQSSLQKASNAIRELLELSPAVSTVLQEDGSWQKVDTQSVAKGAIVRVRPGERISLDGVISQGHSSIDQSPITGESIAVDKKEGDEVFAGTINTNGSFQFQVTAVTADTTLAAIIKVVEQAQNAKAPIQRFIDKFAKVYTPIVFGLSIGIALIMPLMFAGDWQEWVYKALVLLVIACPCALVISTPVTIVSGLTAAARRGILIKGGVYLEQARHIKWLALDKTGTITKGKPQLCDYLLINNLSESSKDPRQLAYSLASLSDHPVSQSIASALQTEFSNPSCTGPLKVDSYTAMVGCGVQGYIAKEQYYLGSVRLARKLGLLTTSDESVFLDYEKQGKTLNLLMTNHQVIALFAVADSVKKESVEALASLKELRVNTIMLSGDNKHTTGAIAKQVGVEWAYGEQLPQDKQAVIERLQSECRPQDARLKRCSDKKLSALGKVAMVGDGINDAPALAKSDIGFAMGALGTDTAIETADVALMDDDLRKIPEFILLSRKAHRILLQNISFAIAVKVVFLAITVLGFADLWMAVFADVGASLLVVANGLRLLKLQPLKESGYLLP